MVLDTREQVIGFCQSRFDQCSQILHDLGTLDSQATLGCNPSNIAQDHLVHVLEVVAHRVQD
jgi:hypothetical protein